MPYPPARRIAPAPWFCLLALAVGAAVAAAEQPNIILILADDFGHECVGAHGGTSYQTPNLDKLAATGMRFDYAYAQPLCTPTRVQIMTGQSNYRNYTRFGQLEPTQRTFGHVLREAGYATGVFGKWQLEGGLSGPKHFGFDDYCLWQLTRRPSRYSKPGLEINGREVDFSPAEYGPDIVNDHAIEFIKKNKARPFLLYYPMMLTHDPFVATPSSPEWGEVIKSRKERQDAKFFADMTAYMDKLIGRLVEAVDQQGLREKTLILFTGDNGTSPKVQSKMGAVTVRGGKGSSKDNGIHVPLIVNWPGVIKPGGVCTDLIDTTDYLPTMCEAAAITTPRDQPLDGRSFLPQLRGQPGQPREWNYCWYAREGGAEASAEFAFNQRFKLYRDGRLYHWAEDREEAKPLPADERKDVRQLLQGALDRYQAPRPEKIVAGGGNKKKRKGGAD